MITRKRGAPTIAEVLELIQSTLETPTGATRRLAELLGCSASTITRWKRGQKRPSLSYMARLREIEERLRGRGKTINEELRGEAGSATSMPHFATGLEVKEEGGYALFRFMLKVPGEDFPKTVGEVLVPVGVLTRAHRENASA